MTSKINRVYPLVIVNMSAKFAEEAHNGLVSIVFTKSMQGRTEGHTHGTIAALLYPHGKALRRDKKV